MYTLYFFFTKIQTFGVFYTFHFLDPPPTTTTTNEQEIQPTEVPSTIPPPQQHVRILTPEHINQQHEVRFQSNNDNNVLRSAVFNTNNNTTDTMQLPPPPPPNVNTFYERQRRNMHNTQETNARQQMPHFMNNSCIRPIVNVNQASGGGVTVQNPQVYMEHMRDMTIGRIPSTNNLICQQPYGNNGNMELGRHRMPPPSYTTATNRCQQPE